MRAVLSRPGAVLAVVLAALILVAALVPLLGLPLWPLPVAVTLPWLVIGVRRLGAAVTWPLLLVGGLFLILALFVLTYLLKLPMLATVAIVEAAVGVVGCVILARAPVRRPIRSIVVLVLASSLGVLVWFISLLTTVGLPAAQRLVWVMAGDSQNNLMFAYTLIRRGGIQVGPGSDPVPLPSAILALAMGPGRDGTASAALLTRDLSGYGQIWALLIGLGCLASGLLIGSAIRSVGGGLAIAAVAAASVSLASLGWVYAGYAMEYGFLSVSLSIPLVCAAISLGVTSRRAPAFAMAGLLIDAAVMLAVWSPLVVMPGVVLLAVLVRERQRLWALPRSHRVLLLVATVLAAAYALGVALPAAASGRAALVAAGGIVALPRWWVFAAGIAVALLAVAVGRVVRSREIAIGTILLSLAGLGTVGVLLFLSRHSTEPWTYYPVKLSWLLLLQFGLEFLALLGILIAHARRRTVQVIAAVAGLAVLGAAAGWSAPPEFNGFRHLSAVSRIADRGESDEALVVAQNVLKLQDLDAPRILWKSTLSPDAEGRVDVWLTLVWSGSAAPSKLRLAGIYAYNNPDIKLLCTIATHMQPDLDIITSDDGLAGSMAKQCPDVPVTFTRG